MLVWLALAGCDGGGEEPGPLRFAPEPTAPSAPTAPTGTVELATAAVRYTGELIGMFVTGADVDGDGLQDLVTASWDAVWSVTSPLASGPIESAGVVLPDPPRLDAMMGLGDTDGDGRAEVAMRIQYMGPISRSAELWAAAVISGADPSQVATWLADPRLYGMEGSYTFSMAAPGDVNGDGLADLALGSTRAEEYAGGVYLLHGPFPANLELGTDEDGLLLGEPETRLGDSLSHGDFDSDGAPDLVLSSRVEVNGGRSVLVVPTDVQGSEVAQTIAFATLRSTGYPQVWAGDGADLDGDGSDDLLVSPSGERTLVAFGPLQGDLLVSDLSDGFYGAGVRSVGDLDGDGVADLGLTDDSDTGPGQIHLWYGPVTGFHGLSDVDATLLLEGGPYDDIPVREPVAGLGDVNGDGFDDLAVGNPFGAGGTTYLLFGGPR